MTDDGAVCLSQGLFYWCSRGGWYARTVRPRHHHQIISTWQGRPSAQNWLHARAIMKSRESNDASPFRRRRRCSTYLYGRPVPSRRSPWRGHVTPRSRRYHKSNGDGCVVSADWKTFCRPTSTESSPKSSDTVFVYRCEVMGQWSLVSVVSPGLITLVSSFF